MTELQTGMNILFNSMRIFWNFFVSGSIPLVVKMLFLSPFVGLIVYLIILVFGGSISGKSDI